MSGRQEQQYIEPESYFIPTQAEVGKLQKEAGELRREVDARETSWVDRTRAGERLKYVEARIQSARTEQRQAVAASAPAAGPKPPTTLIRSDGGEAYLRVPTAQLQNVQHAEPEQQFAAPVPYFATAEEKRSAKESIVGNAGHAPEQEQWPETFAERAELVQAACEELRRVGAAA